MKKILVFGLAVLVLIFAGVHFMNRGGDVRNVERMTAENTLYTQEEIDTAMDIAIKAFSQGFEGCKLLTIAYDEEENTGRNPAPAGTPWGAETYGSGFFFSCGRKCGKLL